MCAFPIRLSGKYIGWLLLLVIVSAGAATAQSATTIDSIAKDTTHRLPVHFFKVGSPLVNVQSWVVAWERRLSDKNSLTFSAQYIQHNRPDALGLFNGNLNLFYTEDVYINRQGYYPYEILDKVVEYVGTAPLPPINEFIPVSSLTFDAGWRLTARTKSRFFWLFEPGITATYHRFIQTCQYVEQLSLNETRVITGESPLFTEQIMVSTDFKQVQEMRYRHQWVPGVSYQIGLGYQLSNNIFMELRGGGIFVPETPYESPHPAPVKPLQRRFMLLVGMGF